MTGIHSVKVVVGSIGFFPDVNENTGKIRGHGGSQIQPSLNV